MIPFFWRSRCLHFRRALTARKHNQARKSIYSCKYGQNTLWLHIMSYSVNQHDSSHEFALQINNRQLKHVKQNCWIWRRYIKINPTVQVHHWSLCDKLQVACIINQHSIGKLFQLILSILLQICVANYTKRNPDQYHCSSIHCLIFHWFCYSLMLFKVITTESNSVWNFGLL